MSDKVAAASRQGMRAKLMVAYTRFQNKEPHSLDELFKLVLDFAYRKVSHLEHDFKDFGSTETADDWAQEVAIRVWKDLQSFDGTPEQFYSWVHKISFNQATDAFNLLVKEKAAKVSLFVEEEDEDTGEMMQESNPEIARHAIHDEERVVSIPEEVQGTDRNICILIRRGYTYTQIGNTLGMSENAVQLRMGRLKRRLAKLRANEKAH